MAEMTDESSASASTNPQPAVPEADAPVPSRTVRVLLRVFEVFCWLVFAVIAGSLAVGVVLIVSGTVTESARVLDGGLFGRLSEGAVEGGYLDVVLTDVPLSVSWPYLAWFAVAGSAWLFLIALVARLTRGLRRGRPFGGVRPVVLFVFAGVWTVLSFAGPAIVGGVRPAMARAANVEIPGATFSYTMTFGDLASILAGPLIAVVVGVLVTGSRMWREQRALV